MTMPIERSTGDPTTKDSTMEVEDDDKTVQSKGSGGKIEEKLTEFLVKVTIKPKQRRTQLTQTEALQIHSEICGAILTVPGSVVIIDNSKEEHATETTLNKTTTQFKLKQREGTNIWIIIMKIRADFSLSVLKNHYTVHDLLTNEKYSVLLHRHNFPESDWNIAKLGMLHNIHVAHVLKDTVTTRIRNTLQQKYP